MVDEINTDKLNCSFCGKPKSDTELLIAGLDAHICYSCIIQAHGIWHLLTALSTILFFYHYRSERLV